VSTVGVFSTVTAVELFEGEAAGTGAGLTSGTVSFDERVSIGAEL
jgi:hypothetical protein